MTNEERFVKFMSLSYVPEFFCSEGFFYVKFTDIPFDDIVNIVPLFDDTHISVDGWTCRINEFKMYVAWDKFNIPEQYKPIARKEGWDI